MAGIGFELNRILKEGRLSSIFKAYSYSLVIGAGPWLISIASILIAAYIGYFFIEDKSIVNKFLVSVTYLVALSLIFSGSLQLSFTRYLADRLFEKDYYRILPNTMGAIAISMGFGCAIMFPVALFSFKDAGPIYMLLFTFIFTTLCGIWVLNAVLTGLKNFKFILFSFSVSYPLVILLAFFLRNYGLNGLMLSLFIGISLLFSLLLSIVVYNYKSDKLIEFDFLKKGRILTGFVFTGIFFNLGVWVDKFLFWFHHSTGERVIGFLRSSSIYDLPMFLAYIAIAPGIGLFFLRLETDFARRYDDYYEAIRTGKTLSRIYATGGKMQESVRFILIDVMIVQTIVSIIIYLASESIFNFFKFSSLHLPLFHINLVGTQLQLFLMSILAILLYLNRKKESLLFTLIFFILNAIFTHLSLIFGPLFYGFGFAGSLLIACPAGLLLLNRVLEDIHYETFMLQPYTSPVPSAE